MRKKSKNKKKTSEQIDSFWLPLKKKLWAIFFFLLAVIVFFSFFQKGGLVGQFFFSFFNFLIGKVLFFLPPLFILASLVSFNSDYSTPYKIAFLAILVFLGSLAGLFETLFPSQKAGGFLGYIFTWPLVKFFGFLFTEIVFISLILISLFLFWYLVQERRPEVLKEKKEEIGKKSFLIKKIFLPRFQVKRIEPKIEPKEKLFSQPKTPVLEPKEAPLKTLLPFAQPPLELLEEEKEIPIVGDIKMNSAIIKKTLENFGIQVEMTEVNIGPTVSQYTLKPAEGVKLSKITALSNDLALALASHPIRIEAPIPGKSQVGIEIPNKTRSKVRLRNLISHPQFQNSQSRLLFVLGKDVSGNPSFADLARMPHLLVAGSTGSGKTIFLNILILSLLYRNSPEILRFILIDPKRVEFQIYNELPYLLTPVIYDVQKTVNVLKWLTLEMERRFNLLSEAKTRDLDSFNQKVGKKGEVMPYIVLIIDELADLMAARGREMEGGIVRLAQMARAVGIHLVVATQRPSVEVITGLIKANITSRITFQVASQVDSRTVLDTAGAEKLLGQGDLLFLSTENPKPKRIQSPFVVEKEIKKVIEFLKSKYQEEKMAIPFESQSLESFFEEGFSEKNEMMFEEKEKGTEDPLYLEAKKIVIEAKKASASLLQRKLKIGYARAARLIDLLENRGVVGPADGAKPREVYLSEENLEEWQKV